MVSLFQSNDRMIVARIIHTERIKMGCAQESLMNAVLWGAEGKLIVSRA